MMKKGHKRKNWTERWFVLRLSSISYFVGEDLAEKKGDIVLDRNCCVEVRGQALQCFLTHTPIRTFLPFEYCELL